MRSSIKQVYGNAYLLTYYYTYTLSVWKWPTSSWHCFQSQINDQNNIQLGINFISCLRKSLLNFPIKIEAVLSADMNSIALVTGSLNKRIIWCF